jgi:thioesterase domain-containing protein
MANVNEQSSANATTGIPLFYLGNDHAIGPLKGRLSADRPFESLEIGPRIIGKLKNPYSLRCIAEHFVKTIRERQPQGPYMLMGWAAHGLLALETAQQLREERQDVALLVLMETINPECVRRQPRWIRGIARWQIRMSLMQFDYMYGRSLREQHAPEPISIRSARKFARMHRDIGNTLRRKSKSIDLTRSTPLDILHAAAANYLPRPYNGPVLLMRSRNGLFGFGGDARLGWGKTLGRKLEVCETQGSQYSMYAEPNIQGVVKQISGRLRAAEERWRHSPNDHAA